MHFANTAMVAECPYDLVGGTVTVFDIAPTTVGVRVQTTGYIDKLAGTWSQHRQWIDPLTGLDSSLYEVELAKTSGSGIVLSNEDSGYFTINTTRSFVDNSVSGFATWGGTMTIREILKPSANLIAFQVNISTEL
jgi:hypothetical protein